MDVQGSRRRVTVEKHNKGVRVRLPGFTYDDVNRYGLLPPDRLAMLIDVYQYVVIVWDSLDHRDQHTADFFAVCRTIKGTSPAFVISRSFTIHPAYYQLNHIYKELDYATTFTKIGKSSFIARRAVYFNGTELFRFDSCNVWVDRKTRIPQSLPVEIRKQLLMFEDRSPSEDVRTIIKPLGSFRTRQLAVHSDTDHMKHINNTKYIRMSQDAVVEAGLSGYLKTITGDPGRCWILKVTCLHKAESFPGDLFVIDVWEDPDIPMLVHTDIMRDSQTTTQVSLQLAYPVVNKL